MFYSIRILSPRLWGTPDPAPAPSFATRFILTPVGNTCPFAVLPSVPFGSSPRLWGTRERSVPTPARFPVHPHACGEHASTLKRNDSASGSSPRLWGTPLRLLRTICRPRFIPTPVGNTPGDAPDDLVLAVHPHACGEHLAKSHSTSRTIGSSPRLWGTHWNAGVTEDGRRFIPTPVGNTSPRPGFHPGCTVHPHACGEHSRPRCACSCAAGSSPRLWGTRPPALIRHLDHRFIPTPVGNTAPDRPSTEGRTVHPHACGEH